MYAKLSIRNLRSVKTEISVCYLRQKQTKNCDTWWQCKTIEGKGSTEKGHRVEVSELPWEWKVKPVRRDLPAKLWSVCWNSLGQWFSECVPWTSSISTPGNLLGRQIFRPHLWETDSDPQRYQFPIPRTCKCHLFQKKDLSDVVKYLKRGWLSWIIWMDPNTLISTLTREQWCVLLKWAHWIFTHY